MTESGAALIALALGLAGVFGVAPARSTLQTGTAFTLTSYANGTVSLNLSQLFDPAALQRALAQHGIPALVKIGTYCSSSPAAPDPGRDGVLSPPGRMVINPAAMPSGTELFIGYYNLGHTLYFDLIYTSSHTCRNAQQPPATP